MSMEPVEVDRRSVVGALATIVGTGSVRGALATLETNVRDVIDVARARGFVASYGGGREFYGLPAWQLLGASYGLLPFVEWTRPVTDGWEARAVVRTVEGNDIGAAEAMCVRSEPNKRRSSDHDLRAMAQTRAQRNALRSVLGSALVLAGFDFADPDAPATKDQTKALWTLADKHGWSREEAHERAGVESLTLLTREQASELIDAWSDLTSGEVVEGVSPVEEAVEAEGTGKDPQTSTVSANVAPDNVPPYDGATVAHGSGQTGERLDPWATYQDSVDGLDPDRLAAVRRLAIEKRYGWPPKDTWSEARLLELADLAQALREAIR